MGNENMTLWLCGRFTSNWEILGAFSTEELALARCTRYNDFVAPLELDKSLPEELTEWPGFYYPSESEEKT